jgi:hypothetical protein
MDYRQQTRTVNNAMKLRFVFVGIARVISLFCAALLCCGAQAILHADDQFDFQVDIKPLLSDRCFKCHGPDEKQNVSGLRLDQPDSVKLIIDKEHPESSELFQRITSKDPDYAMPPPDSKLSLSADEVRKLKLWIGSGGTWDVHWSFKPIDNTVVPSSGNSDGESAIDSFVRKRLADVGLKPNPRADRYSLIRRITFDLTGLPPTPAEIEGFVNDKDPDAYEKVVDRLLASPQYGERMASMWLDVARYSDTYGYQVDRDRFVWPWRDWVVRSFNENKSYNEFLTEQIAGDLLPNATTDQILATTFNRLHPQKVEGGSVPEEFRVEYVADRTQTVATAFLGLTFECCRCHDHKYDPISQEEYYQLYAFFNNIDEAGLYSFFTESVPTPTLWLPSESQMKQLDNLKAEVAERDRALAALPTPDEQQVVNWLGQFRSGIAQDSVNDTSGQVEYHSFDNRIEGDNRSAEGKQGLALELSGDDEYALQKGNFPRWQPFSFSLWINSPKSMERAVVFHRSKAWTDAGSRGYQLLIENDRLSFALVHFWPGNAVGVITTDKIKLNQWTHVAITYDGSARAAGIKIFIDGEPAALEVVRDSLTKHITGGGGDNIAIGARFRDHGFTGGKVDEFKVFDRKLSELEAYCFANGVSVRELLGNGELDKKTLSDPLLGDFLQALYDKERTEMLEALKNARSNYSRLQDQIAEIMVMRELPLPRESFVLERGMYDSPAKRVFPSTPKFLPAMDESLPRNRLGLARWLTDPGNPLTSRVAVNRFWQLCFGNGLVSTGEDFGNQGLPPSHGQLLDWLAADFVKHDWDIKRLIKSMVMSETYRQSSTITASQIQIDPKNIYLSRASRQRFPAEMIRDNILAVSGLLVSTVGGEPAKPYEVARSFHPVAPDKGSGLYRRSLYTYWKRNGPAPVMMTLDASQRDVCRVKRDQTNTSLQALVLLNDPQMIEAARVYAQTMLADGQSDQAIIKNMFYGLTSRFPNQRELDRLTELYEQQFAHYQSNPDQVDKYLSIGEAKIDPSEKTARLGAMSIVSITIMNHHDCLYRR